ncbi:MAG: FAD-dependent oxidoreductase [Halanaerobiales bacterium]
MRHKTHKTEICIIGGGLAGICAAIAAARHGTEVVLMQDRPVLGGNASSEIRMWICGAHGEYNRETGIIEELLLENLYRNPNRKWPIWDSVLYEKVKFEDNITLLLNCSCNDLTKEGDNIKSVKGWQLTTETWHKVEADLFMDCSGDSILAPLSGAEYRMGREARSEFNESIEPEEADNKTMGMSLLIQARETPSPKKFIPPEWAYTYESDEDLPNRGHDILKTNFWWIEVGGEQDTIHDTEEARDELLKIAFGVWDHIKNQKDHGAENWELDWLGFLPGKRESRRYVGDYILDQNDVRAEGKFDDLVAYGGWTMDDHHPAGFYHPGNPTIFHPAPSPFGIPYRCLYSKNVNNLLFAGRNISASHAALSATRVMATTAVLGQAAGTAAHLAVKNNLTPRGVYENKVKELKQTLMEDDCYLPWNKKEMPELTQKAELNASEGDPEPLRNGVDRPVDGEENCWKTKPGTWAEYRFRQEEKVDKIRLVFDSDLKQNNKGGELHLPCRYHLEPEYLGVPETMIKKFRIEALNKDEEWEVIYSEDNNYQRLVNIEVDCKTEALRLIPEKTWGNEMINIFAWEIE